MHVCNAASGHAELSRVILHSLHLPFLLTPLLTILAFVFTHPTTLVPTLQTAVLEDQFTLPDGSFTLAEPRPNAYIPQSDTELPLPKPYGSQAPFKPSQPGATMRHIIGNQSQNQLTFEFELYRTYTHTYGVVYSVVDECHTHYIIKEK